MSFDNIKHYFQIQKEFNREMLSYINKNLISNSKPTLFNDETLDTFLLNHFCAFSYLSSIHSMKQGIHFKKVEIILLFIGDSLYTKNINNF